MSQLGSRALFARYLAAIALLVVASSSCVSVAAASKSVFAYVSFEDGTVAQYSVSPTGVLTPLNPASVKVDRCPGIYVDPKGRFAYVSSSTRIGVDQYRRTISQFRIEKGGTLTPLNPPGVSVSDLKTSWSSCPPSPQFGVFDHSGRFLYVALAAVDGFVAQFAVSNDGTLSPLNPAVVEAGNSPGRVAIHPTRPLLFVGNRYDQTISRYTIGKDGTLTALEDKDWPAYGGGDLACSPDGKYLYTTADRSQLLIQYAIEQDGSLREVSKAPFASDDEEDLCCGAASIAIDQSGDGLYLTESYSGNMYRFSHVTSGELAAKASTFRVTTQGLVKSKEVLRSATAAKANKALGPLAIRDAEHKAVASLTSGATSVARGPDGAFYVLHGLGVARFENKGSSVVSAAKASVSWTKPMAAASAVAAGSATQPQGKEESSNSPLSIAIVSRDE